MVDVISTKLFNSAAAKSWPEVSSKDLQSFVRSLDSKNEGLIKFTILMDFIEKNSDVLPTSAL